MCCDDKFPIDYTSDLVFVESLEDVENEEENEDEDKEQ